MSGKVLILGASGRFGRHAAEAFWNKGWQVRLFDRKTDDLQNAAADVDVIVNAWNPPFDAWKTEVPALTQTVITVAKSSGASVLIPGNIYGYGEGSDELLTKDTAKQAQNTLGVIRNQMEQAYRDAGVKTIVLRAGNFLDTEPSGNWFDKIIVAGLEKGMVVSPGPVDCPQSWAYLPDLARAAVDLAEQRHALDDFQEVLFEGYTLSLRDLTRLLETATGRSLRVKRMNWLPIWIARPFWPLAAGILEMRYLWSMPHRLDSVEMEKVLPKFRATDPLTAVTSAIGHLDVYPDQSMSGSTLDIPAE